jgi:hypothetical protein
MLSSKDPQIQYKTGIYDCGFVFLPTI